MNLREKIIINSTVTILHRGEVTYLYQLFEMIHRVGRDDVNVALRSL